MEKSLKRLDIPLRNGESFLFRNSNNNVVVTSLIVFLTVLCSVQYGCSENAEKGDSVISTEGTYNLSLTNDKLVVSYENELVVFEIRSAAHRIQKFNEEASVYSKWSMFWEEEKKQLWFNSSDVGIFLFAKKTNGDYSRNVVAKSSPETQQMPKQFLTTLPQTMQDMIQNEQE